MNREERIKLVKAMEFIARQTNDEEVFDYWLTLGVADGDILYSDLSYEEDQSDLDYYIEDDVLADLMRTFLRLMVLASKSGGIYCDSVVSNPVKR